jgi:hypothetical protein
MTEHITFMKGEVIRSGFEINSILFSRDKTEESKFRPLPKVFACRPEVAIIKGERRTIRRIFVEATDSG